MHHLDVAPDQDVALREERAHPGVGDVVGAVDLACLDARVAGVDIAHGDGAAKLIALVAESDDIASRQPTRLVRGERERDRQRPRRPAGKAGMLDDGLVIVARHETGQRRIRAVTEHLQVRHHRIGHTQ